MTQQKKPKILITGAPNSGKWTYFQKLLHPDSPVPPKPDDYDKRAFTGEVLGITVILTSATYAAENPVEHDALTDDRICTVLCINPFDILSVMAFNACMLVYSASPELKHLYEKNVFVITHGDQYAQDQAAQDAIGGALADTNLPHFVYSLSSSSIEDTQFPIVYAVAAGLANTNNNNGSTAGGTEVTH